MNKTTLTIVAAAVVVALAAFGIVKGESQQQSIQTPSSKPSYEFNEKSKKKVLDCVEAGRSLDECIRIENFRNIDFQ